MAERYRIAVVGGGAAGLMAAIAAAEAGEGSVILFEGNKRCGTKILMSGGTRCNVTNKSVGADDYFGGSRNFIKNVLRGFDDNATHEFFSRLGVRLKLEESGKYFPDDDRASTVLNALTSRAKELNVKIMLFTKIEGIGFQKGQFHLISEKNEYEAQNVILTTGGKSYPTTGSDGSGYSLARKFGHTVTPTFPALSPLLLNEPRLTALSGVTIQAGLMLFLNGRKHIEFEGSMLFTHFGLSGPVVLNISREVERLKNEETKLFVNFLPGYNYEELQALFRKAAAAGGEKTIAGFLRTLMPLSLAEAVMGLAGVGLEKRFNNITRDEQKKLVQLLTGYHLKVSGVRGFQQAEATAGGVKLDEVKYQTMESRLQPGLYFAGELLDVDGLLGGYNFQWAWSSGYIAGKSAAERLGEF